ncbi:glycosyl transferase, partial [Streptomyces sp. SID7909]|nr:glycosyl transferase [Streptomyces sp. SID7909]
WLVCSTSAAAAGLALAVARNGWEPNWGLGLYLLVQLQINTPLIRDLLTELRPAAAPRPARAPRRSGTAVLPRRWPEALAVTATLMLTALLASGWVNPMLPWLS